MSKDLLMYVLMIGVLIQTAPLGLVIRDGYNRIKNGTPRNRLEIAVLIAIFVYLAINWLLVISVLALKLTGHVSD